MTTTLDHAIQDPFLIKFRGGFSGIITWEQLAMFWDVLRANADAGWYLYAIGQALPERPRPPEEILKFIDEIDALLRREHDEDYCGIVYTDDKAQPSFVKIFDPHHLGTSCGSSKNPPLPGWILCLLRPCSLESNQIVPGNRRRFWEKLWG